MNDRAVSEVLGSMLIFALVVMLLGILQATAVPQQNADVEFKHTQQVSDQVVDLRTAIMDAAKSGGERTASITLGTEYPSRFFLINPPPAPGTLQTTAPATMETKGPSDFSVKSACDLGSGGSSVHTRTIEYKADYNTLQSAPTIGYEHGFTYRKYEDGLRIDNEQVLINGDTITLLPFTDDFSRNGVSKTSIDIASSRMGQTPASPSGDFQIIIPSGLEARHWRQHEELLEDELADGTVKKVEDNGDRIEITFPGGTDYDVRCSVLSLDDPPSANPPIVADANSLGVNPNGPEGVIFDGASMRGNDNEVEVTLHNRDDDTWQNVTHMRLAFYNPNGQGGSGADEQPGSAKVVGTSFNHTGEFADVDDINIEPSLSNSFTLEFYCGLEGGMPTYKVAQGDFFVVTVLFENGETANYFIGSPSTTSPGGTRCSGP